jgi:hypothetical protein
MDGTNQNHICVPTAHCSPPDAGMPDTGTPDAGQSASDGAAGGGDAQPEMCACDLTTACDKNCPCDPDCSQAGGKSCGCTMVPSEPEGERPASSAAPVLSLLGLGLVLSLRRKRNVH